MQTVNVEFDKRKRIDVKDNVLRLMRKETKNANYAFPTRLSDELTAPINEQYYKNFKQFVGIDDLVFFSDAQRMRPDVIHEKVFRNMRSQFDINLFCKPIDVVVYVDKDGKAYNVCVDGQCRYSFALISGIKKFRCNLVKYTNDWNEVCKFTLQLNDWKNSAGISHGQIFDMLLEQRHPMAVEIWDYLNELYDTVHQPKDSPKNAVFSQNVFGVKEDWSNLLNMFEYNNNDMSPKHGRYMWKLALKWYHDISWKFNNYKGFNSWDRCLSYLVRKMYDNLKNDYGDELERARVMQDIFEKIKEMIDWHNHEQSKHFDYLSTAYLSKKARKEKVAYEFLTGCIKAKVFSSKWHKKIVSRVREDILSDLKMIE